MNQADTSWWHINDKKDRFELLNWAATQRLMEYGDGIFESIRIEGSHAPLFDLHWKRLSSSAEHFSFQLEEKTLILWKTKVLYKINASVGSHRMKLLLSRPKGKGFMPSSEHAFLLLKTEKLEEKEPKSQQLMTSERMQWLDPFISNHKTCNSLPYVLAANEKNRRACDGIILHNHQVGIIECDQSNLFFIRDQVAYTPPLDSGCLNGVCRHWMIQELQGLGIEVVEKRIDLTDLPNFDEIIATNAIRGPIIVKGIDHYNYGKDEIGAKLKSRFSKLFKKNTPAP